MTIRRKLTLAMSYLRSVYFDVVVSSGTSAHLIEEAIRTLRIVYRLRPDLVGKCYNIRNKKRI